MRLKAALAAHRRRLRLCPDRLSALAVDADAERPVRGAWRHHSDAVRVLRAGRPVRPGEHHQEGACQPQSRPQDHRPAARHVRPAQHAVATRCRHSSNSISATRCSNPGAAQRAIWPRRRATASRRAVRQGAKGAQAYMAFARRNDRTRQAAIRHGRKRHEPTQTERPRPRPRCTAGGQQCAGNAAPGHAGRRMLQPGKYQPRTRMDPGSLEELAGSRSRPRA
jgi:hypothetical protein